MKNNIENLLDALPVKNTNYVLHKAKRRGFNLNKHIHKECEIIFVDYGVVELTIRQKAIMLNSGDCVLPPCRLTSFTVPMAVRFLNITFYGESDSSISCKTSFFNHEERSIMLKLKNEYLTENRFTLELIVIILNQLLLLIQPRLSPSCFEQSTVQITGENNLNHRSNHFKGIEFYQE
jgi:hypothetical protein